MTASADAKMFVIVASAEGAGPAAARLVAGAPAGAVSIAVPRPTDDLYPREHLPQTLFAAPKLGVIAAIIEYRGSIDAPGTFSLLQDRAAAAGLERLSGYVVDENVVLDGPPGDPGPMPGQPLKMFSIGRWRSDVTPAKAASHWRLLHAPLAVRHHVGMSRYVQNVVVSRLGSASSDVDLIAELWFARPVDFLERFYDSPAGRGVIAADANEFAGGGDTWFCVETSSSASAETGRDSLTHDSSERFGT